jgi:hypothetical protein
MSNINVNNISTIFYGYNIDTYNIAAAAAAAAAATACQCPLAETNSKS